MTSGPRTDGLSLTECQQVAGLIAVQEKVAACARAMAEAKAALWEDEGSEDEWQRHVDRVEGQTDDDDETLWLLDVTELQTQAWIAAELPASIPRHGGPCGASTSWRLVVPPQLRPRGAAVVTPPTVPVVLRGSWPAIKDAVVGFLRSWPRHAPLVASHER